MSQYKKIARIVGFLFITSTIAAVISVFLLEPLLSNPDYFTSVSANKNRVILGAIFELLCAAAFVCITIFIFPVLKRESKNVAIGYVIGRSFEAIPFIISVTALLTLLTISSEYVQVGVENGIALLPVGTLLLAVRDWCDLLGARMFCGFAAMPFYYILYRAKLVPRFLSIWGLIGTLIYLTIAFMIMFDVNPNLTTEVILTLPFALNEMVLAVWLIVKGFNSSANSL
jgi:Domain of unknown function (DUF4386)